MLLTSGVMMVQRDRSIADVTKHAFAMDARRHMSNSAAPLAARDSITADVYAGRAELQRMESSAQFDPLVMLGLAGFGGLLLITGLWDWARSHQKAQ